MVGRPPANWRRGLIRLWLVVAAMWVIFVGWKYYDNTIRADIIFECVDKASAAHPQLNTDEVLSLCLPGPKWLVTMTLRSSTRTLAYLGLAIGPPVGLFGLFAIGLWIARGFLRPPSS